MSLRTRFGCLFLSLLVMAGTSRAQSDLIKPILLNERSGLQFFKEGLQWGIGARAISMGGAYSAIGEDYTATYWNPAALAQIRRFEVTGGLSHLAREIDTSFDHFRTADDASFTNLNELGFAYPVPTYRGSLVFGFGYNRIRSFDTNFALDVFNSLPQDSVTQSWRRLEEGSFNNWTVAGAIDLSPNLSAGIGLNFWSGSDDYQFTTKEVDSQNIYTFDDYRLDDNISSKFSGFNVTFGALYRLGKMLRLAGTLSTPTTLTVKEEWMQRERTTFDIDESLPDEIFTDEGATEYKIRTPFTFTAGASLNLIGFLLLSGQLEFTDWQQLSYRSDVPIVIAISDDFEREILQDEANEAIKESFRETRRLRLGAEMTVPGTATQLRLGYFRDPSPFRDAARADREFFSAGLGLLLDKQIKLDLAYVFGTWEQSINDPASRLNDFVDQRFEEVTVNKLFATLSVRF